MNTTRRGFMGLLAAFGLTTTLPVEALASVESAPVLPFPPQKLGMWVRPLTGDEWRYVGALQSLSVEPELTHIDHLYRDPITRKSQVISRHVINRSYRIEAELEGIDMPQELIGAPVSLRYTLRLSDGEHEITVKDAVIDSGTATISVINDGFSFMLEATATGDIGYRVTA